jgi:hypothetical protein
MTARSTCFAAVLSAGAAASEHAARMAVTQAVTSTTVR